MQKMGASMKLRKKEIFKVRVGYSRILTCSSMRMKRHTDIKKNRISKEAWKAMIINGENCSKTFLY